MRKLPVVPRLALALALALAAVPAPASQQADKGVAVAFPWTFQKGTDTARETVFSTVGEIGQKAKYDMSSHDEAFTVWEEMKLKTPAYGTLPSASALRKYGKSLHAKVVLYGSVSWHTRSIWVNAGPK
ncbi:MAG: hypothetical protein JSS65_04685, partial [Armatimonadetes bacterium]|nr:hypothetical protein [Armatimonadota bacterium]